MKEKLISRETAEKAKAAGFNLTTEYFYCNYGISCITGDGEFLSTENEGVIYDCNGEWEEGERIYCPTQTELQDWLRVVKNSVVYVVPVRYSGVVMYEAHIVNGTTGVATTYPDDVSNTWEGALEEGLQKALDRINDN